MLQTEILMDELAVGQGLEFKPTEVTLERDGKLVDLSCLSRVLIFRGWTKGTPDYFPPETFIELQKVNESGITESATYKLDTTSQPSLRVTSLNH